VASFNRRTYEDEPLRYTSKTADATLVYVLEQDAEGDAVPTLDEVEAKKKELLGYTKFPPSSGVTPDDARLVRIPPMAHPEAPNLFVSSLSVMPVRDTPAFLEADADPDEWLEAPSLPKTVLWDSYVFTITFQTRPYAIIRDESIVKTAGTWYGKDNDDPIDYHYYPEWYRYTEFIPGTREDVAKAKRGKRQYVTSEGPPPAPTKIHGREYPGLVTMPLPNSTLTVIWYEVPLRYVFSSSSYLEKYRYHINQNTWEDYPPGALLFKGYTIQPYTPPFADLDPAWATDVFAAQKMCDIKMEFLVTDRPLSLAPTTPPPLKNYIMGGWNLEPEFGTRKFYYVQDDLTKVPNFFSVDFPLLFQDPDVS
jgi:hypothetical protein